MKKNFKNLYESIVNPVTGIIIMILMILYLLAVVCYVTDEHEKERQSETYALTAVVIDVSRENDTVTVEDFGGNLWEFSECEDWMVGDICAMVMNDSGTEEVRDDEIESVRYDGWFEGWR